MMVIHLHKVSGCCRCRKSGNVVSFRVNVSQEPILGVGDFYTQVQPIFS